MKLYVGRLSHVSQLSVHTKKFTQDRNSECRECKTSFSCHSALIAHKKIHTGDKPCESKECSKSYCHKYDLALHQKTHTGEKPYACKECSKTFLMSVSPQWTPENSHSRETL